MVSNHGVSTSFFTIWNKQTFNSTKIVAGKGFILVSGDNRTVGAGVQIALMNVYGPSSNSEKSILWS